MRLLEGVNPLRRRRERMAPGKHRISPPLAGLDGGCGLDCSVGGGGEQAGAGRRRAGPCGVRRSCVNRPTPQQRSPVQRRHDPGRRGDELDAGHVRVEGGVGKRDPAEHHRRCRFDVVGVDAETFGGGGLGVAVDDEDAAALGA